MKTAHGEWNRKGAEFAKKAANKGDFHSSIMAAILSALPAVKVHFVAFSTEILDLSDRVQDPLGLLLEFSVGGGTHISKGLRYARSLITVPTLTPLELARWVGECIR